MEKLKPCPFCGTFGPGLYVTSNAYDAPFVECNNCGSCGPVEATEERAIESWNSRAPEPHTHVNNGQDDACAKCGLDLRNPVHLSRAEPPESG